MCKLTKNDLNKNHIQLLEKWFQIQNLQNGSPKFNLVLETEQNSIRVPLKKQNN